MFKITKADRKDANAVYETRKATILAGCPGYYSNEEVDLWTKGEISDEFAVVVEQKMYIVSVEGEVVGTGMINLENGVIDAIFVHPEYMGQGVGSKMMQYLEVLARKAGLTKLRLESTLNAVEFYRSCGFTGNDMSRYKSPRGIELDCVPMQKDLERR